MAVDLSASGEAAGTTSRATRAAERARAGIAPYPLPSANLETHASDPWVNLACNAVELDATTGTLQYRLGSGEPRSLMPTSDGQPALKGAGIVSAQQGGDVLAVQVEASTAPDLWFLSLSRSAVIGTGPSSRRAPGEKWFTLSRDGRRFARPVGDDEVEIRDVPGDRPTVLVTRREHLWVHFASLGRSCLLVREFAVVGRRRPQAHLLIRWDSERLGVDSDHDDAVQVFLKLGGVAAESRSVSREQLPPRSDLVRFVQIVEHGALRILIDQFNHLAVLGRGGELIAMFYVAGKEFAAWMPDGTRLGTGRLIGGEPSKAAAERIAAALRSAERGEGGRR